VGDLLLLLRSRPYGCWARKPGKPRSPGGYGYFPPLAKGGGGMLGKAPGLSSPGCEIFRDGGEKGHQLERLPYLDNIKSQKIQLIVRVHFITPNVI